MIDCSFERSRLWNSNKTCGTGFRPVEITGCKPVPHIAQARDRVWPVGWWRSSVIVRGLMLLTLAAAGCATAERAAMADQGRDDAPDARYVDSATLDASVPTPQSVIGHGVGDRPVRYDVLVAYLKKLSDTSPLVTMTPYAHSHEGRGLYYLTITSEQNHARLDRIRADNAMLADPRTLADEVTGGDIIKNLPGVAWMAYNIHGDELSSTDAAMQLVYQLAAGTDDATRRLRDELVIHVDPLMNPDGRERYLGQLEQLTGVVPNNDYQSMQHGGLWSAGRGNHYLFDLNRDWLMQVHPETRGRSAAILRWNPHLLVDSHEMGGLDTYLFDPPREPFNNNLSGANHRWRERFSADQARAFDQHGWSYYTREWYEEWYPGYTNAWANLLGAVGILYEQAGVNGAAIKQATGRELTYHEAVHHHLTSSLANLETLRANRAEILRDFAADRRWAVSDEGPGMQTLLIPPTADASVRDRLIDLLLRHGIEMTEASGAFDARDVVDVGGVRSETKTLPAGTIIIAASQPHRRLMRAVLEFDPHMSDQFLLEERIDLENRRGSRLYDVTSWNLCMAYGLEAYWAEEVDAVSAKRIESVAKHTPADPGAGRYGFLFDGADSNIYRVIATLLARDCKPRVATKAFKVAGRAYRPGTILLRNHEHDAALAAIVREVSQSTGMTARAVDTALAEEGPDLGGRRFALLQQPRVAVASQWPVSTTSFGAMWFLIDQRIGLRCSPINIQSLGRIDLRKYNVLILPEARGGSLSAVLDKAQMSRLKDWVRSGGTLIAMGGSATFLASESRGISAVRRKRDVLDQLPVYAEALGRERAAGQVKVDPAEVWGALIDDQPSSSEGTPGDEPTTSNNAAKGDDVDAKKKKDGDVEALKRTDEWQRVFSPSGAMMRASLDEEHWLCFGLGDELAVLMSGSTALMSRRPVATPVRLATKDRLRLSGLLWPEARARWAGTAYATVERIGHGQVILFADDPFLRGYLEGTGRLLQNAILLGPGVGTRTALPW